MDCLPNEPLEAKAGLPRAAAAGAAAVVSLAAAGLSAAEPSEEMAKILEKLPADDYDTAQQLCEKLLAGGPATIVELVNLVGDAFGDPKGAKPKYALHGLVMHAARPGADNQRKMLAETLARELDAEHSDELKAFLCRQLQLCGRAEEARALAKLLDDDRLGEPARQAMAAIRGEVASSAAAKGGPSIAIQPTRKEVLS